MPSVGKQTNRPAAKRGGSAWDRIEPVKLNDEGRKFLIYGRAGTGKTELWSTFPKPILGIICSGGDETRTIHKKKGIDIVTLEESAEIQELVDKQKETEHYQTVVLDHGTDFQGLILKEILGLEELPVQSSWGLASQNQYGQCSLQTKERLRSLLELKCNVIIIAHERGADTGAESEVLLPTVGAAFTPSTAGWVNTACEYICQAFLQDRVVAKKTTIGKGPSAKTVTTYEKVKGKVDYCLRTAPHPVFTTKFRVPRGTDLPSYLVDPSFEKIEALINGG